MNKKLSQVISDLQVYFCKYLKRGSAKNCPRYFDIRKYTFLNI